MMREILNAMRLQSEQAANVRASARLGTVSSYDPDNYAAKVMIQPEGVETGWLPVASDWVGNGWGLYMPPSIGDVVEVEFQEADINAGIICRRIFTNAARPLAVPSGEFWLVHQAGSSLKFHNDGSVELIAAGTLTSSAPQWNHSGNVHITGTLDTSGNITGGANITAQANIADQGGTKTMAGMRSTFNGHTHSDPQGGSVGTPSGTM